MGAVSKPLQRMAPQPPRDIPQLGLLLPENLAPNMAAPPPPPTQSNTMTHLQASTSLRPPAELATPLEPTAELLEELKEANHSLEAATPEAIIQWASDRFAPHLTMATAFGPEGCVILSMLSRVAPATYVFNLETGYQFQQTLDLRDQIAEKYGIQVDLRKPELSVPEYEALHGGPLYKTNPDQCCFDRKITVLRQAVKGKHAWMSGIRRDQSSDRSKITTVAWDRKFNLVKISPLASWVQQDVWKRIADEAIPYNRLHDQGYPSVGCWPCTRAVPDGNHDERAGRWSGTEKTECGLHSLEADGSGI